MPAYWLLKSEPGSWSFQDQIDAGAKGTFWSGVRNHTAKRHLQAMAVGDHAFFYHSNEGKAVVGIVTVIKPYYPDPSDATGKFGMVDVKAVRAVPHPVTLEAIKRESALADMVLVRNARMSVQPVTDDEWHRVCAMGGVEA